MKIICISGRARHGKDTTASFLKEELETQGYKVLITHYADLLKYICKTFFNWDGVKDDKGRTLLQYVATDIVRAKEPNYWVNFLIGIFKLFESEWDYVLIADVRFPNEISALKDSGFNVSVVKIVRSNFNDGLTEAQRNHKSELSVDKIHPDILINNKSTLEALKTEVSKIAQLEQILQ